VVLVVRAPRFEPFSPVVFSCVCIDGADRDI